MILFFVCSFRLSGVCESSVNTVSPMLGFLSKVEVPDGERRVLYFLSGEKITRGETLAKYEADLGKIGKKAEVTNVTLIHMNRFVDRFGLHLSMNVIF